MDETDQSTVTRRTSNTPKKTTWVKPIVISMDPARQTNAKDFFTEESYMGLHVGLTS